MGPEQKLSNSAIQRRLLNIINVPHQKEKLGYYHEALSLKGIQACKHILGLQMLKKNL
jgi:hypothetical protein